MCNHCNWTPAHSESLGPHEQACSVLSGHLWRCLKRAQQKNKERRTRGRVGVRKRSSLMRHPPPSSTLSSGLCLVLQGTKLLPGTTVLFTEYFTELLSIFKVSKFGNSSIAKWKPEHTKLFSSLGSQLRRHLKPAPLLSDTHSQGS